MLDPGKGRPLEIRVDGFHLFRRLQRIGKWHDCIHLAMEHPNGLVLHLGDVPPVMDFVRLGRAGCDRNKSGDIMFSFESVFPSPGAAHAATENVVAQLFFCKNEN
mgnify:CR=1 FL=1